MIGWSGATVKPAAAGPAREARAPGPAAHGGTDFSFRSYGESVLAAPPRVDGTKVLVGGPAHAHPSQSNRQTAAKSRGNTIRTQASN